MHELRSFAILQLWAKQVVGRNDSSHFVSRRPEATAEPRGKIRSPPGEFGRLAAHDLPVKHIGLKLHQPVVFACASIGEKNIQLLAGCLLQSHRKHPSPETRSSPGQHARRFLSSFRKIILRSIHAHFHPNEGSQAGQGRNEIDVAIVFQVGCKLSRRLQVFKARKRQSPGKPGA
jgi:hypothetical protein